MRKNQKSGIKSNKTNLFIENKNLIEASLHTSQRPFSCCAYGVMKLF